MKNFWQELRTRGTPITVLAPMEEVTDMVFRMLVAELGRPDVFFTEFTSVEGINSVGQAKVIHRLKYNESERPIVAQMWGTTPEHYRKAAELAVEMGFDGLDINMGCPVPKVIKRGACSALINNHQLAKEIVEATREGLAGRIPLSIKTRIGFREIATEEWIGFVLRELKPDALTVHLRTVRELSVPEPHWEEMGKIVALRDQYAPSAVVIGNGNIDSVAEIAEQCNTTGMDGGMIGRGIFRNPWVFAGRDPDTITIQEKLETLVRHTKRYVEVWGEDKNFAALKRFFKIYAHGFDGASGLRLQLMECKNVEQVIQIVQDYLATSNS
jgi:tRNA-dihydrouridine synthase